MTRRRINRRGWLLARRLLKLLLGPPFRIGSRLVVEGQERLPKSRRPLVVACNHPALIDTFYLTLAIRPRFVVCGAKPSYFRNRRLRALTALANVLEVRDHDTYLEDCAQLLRAGEVLLIYPEMGRRPEGLGRFETWAAEVALDNQVPVLPCFLHGTGVGQRGPVKLVVGQELRLDGDPAAATAELRSAIAGLDPTVSPEGDGVAERAVAR